MEHTDPLERATSASTTTRAWTDDDFRAAREADLAERTVPVGSMIAAVVGCLLLATLLTSGKLVEIASRMEFGENRDRALDAAEAVDRVANFLSLNRPYDVVTDIRAANNDRGSGDAVVVVTTTTTAAPTTTATPPAADDPSTTTSSTTTTTAPVGRVVSDAAPLRVYVAGDSQATYLGQALTTEADLPFEVETDDRISTSLARPDYFDWPTRWAEVIADSSPEAVVLFIGANDHQDMADASGERLVEGTVAWQAEWRARLTTSLDVLTADGAVVFWVTQPPMRDDRLDDGIQQLNLLAAEVIAGRGDVVIVDIWELFGGESGFAERVTGPDGDTIEARIGDGVHLSRSGASWVGDLVEDAIEARWEFGG